MKLEIKITALAFILLLASCKKKDNDTAPEDNSTTTSTTTTGSTPAVIDINHAPVVKFTMNGSDFSYPSSGITGGMGTSKSIGTSMTDTSTAYYDYGFSSNTATYFEVQKGVIYTIGIGSPGEDAFRNFFATGTYNYAPANKKDGIVISVRDLQGKMWSSQKGSADQSGSVFKIENNKETDDGYQRMKVYATFNCKVYDDAGNSSTLTNGKFVGHFENN